MSLYNLLFGVEPTAGIALKMLGIGPGDVPRFRDAYFTWSEDETPVPVIVVHTRTGGGNREEYEAENDAMGLLPGFRFDRDDDFDSTYADFVFDVPEAERTAVAEFLTKNGKPATPAEKFEAVMKSLKGG